MKPEDIGLVNTKGEDEKQPFLVAFLKASGNEERIVTRKKRQTGKKRNYSVSEPHMRNPYTGKILLLNLVVVLEYANLSQREMN